jgi:DNA replication ATP-dependent helicase Dna2
LTIMKPNPITSVDILKFIDGEFRTAARDVLELHGLDIEERVEQFRCLPVVHEGGFVFSYRENSSKFRTGDYVLLNPHLPSTKGETVAEGSKLVIGSLDEKTKRLTLDDPFNLWSNTYDPCQGENCLIDERTVSRFPLYTYPAWASGYLSTLKEPGCVIQEILSGGYRDTARKGRFPDPPEFLLKSQKKAFRHALRHPLSLVQGPPGTGKTFLIAQIVEAFVKMGLRVFICAFSHRAINNALNACVRNTSLTQVAKIGGGYVNDDLDERANGDRGAPVVGMTAFEAFKSRAALIRKAVKDGGYIRPAIPEVRDETYWRKLDEYTRTIFEAGIGNRSPEYEVAVFDEASQLLIHHALMAMPFAKQYIFVGDHQQMPPVIQGFHKGNPVNQSVFSYLMAYYPSLNHVLDETRRMNSAITAFPSSEYYGNGLKPIPDAKGRRLLITAVPQDRTLAEIVDPEASVVFVHVNHSDYAQECPEEARVVAQIVFELVARCGIDPKDGLCVVAAYRRQNNLIRQYIAEIVNRQKRLKKGVAQKLLSPDLIIDTVERIQGQERDVVIVSLTASDEEHIKSEKEFLMMPNRMNVSFTRPRTKLIVVGSKGLFRVIPADRDEQSEHVVDGRTVLRSKGILLSNHFKRWYFHVKGSQRIVDATNLAGKPL